MDLNDRRLIRRIFLWHAALLAAGLVAWLVLAGVGQALGFLAGGVAATFSFAMLHKFTGALEGQPASPGFLVLSAVRILLIGGALFVIIERYRLHETAVLTGILVTVTAITIEVLREFFYA